MTIKGRKVRGSTILKLIYTLFLIFSVCYVWRVLDEDSFSVVEKKTKKKTVKQEETNVKLVLFRTRDSAEYAMRLTKSDSAEDFLAGLRESGLITYEVDTYTYGKEIVCVFNEEPANGYRWAFLYNNKDFTNSIATTRLEDGAVYLLKQVTRSEER